VCRAGGDAKVGDDTAHAAVRGLVRRHHFGGCAAMGMLTGVSYSRRGVIRP
jgi:hypothetical protein